MPQWEAATEVWLRRMLDGLSRDLTAVAVNDSKGNRYLQPRIPIFSLYPPARELRYFSRLFDLFGLQLQKPSRRVDQLLRNLLKQLPVAQILCQYGVYASKFMDVWQDIDLPLFVHFHGYDVFFDLRLPDHPDKHFHPEDYYSNVKALEKRAVLIAGSHFMKGQLVKAGIAPEKIVVKYYGVPLPEARHIHHKKETLQILHLGRFVDFKSPDRTIQAFEIARSRGLDARLVMVGDGPLRPYCELLRLRSRYRDSIRFLEPVSSQDAQALYAASDIFTQHNIAGEMTRQSEGFGVVMLEAMASGLPIVGTEHGGVVESVVHGETGLLNAPGDVEAQAESFIQLGRNCDLRQQMADAGRSRVASYFTPEREIQQLREIMKLPSHEHTK
jgi:glycosyltransferase involved in cell wall biosynthesis